MQQHIINNKYILNILLIKNKKISLTSFFLIKYTIINPLNIKNISTPNNPFPNNKSPKSF